MVAAVGGKLRLEDFDVQGEISKGSFGVVFKIVRKADGRVLALKQVKLSGMKRVDRQEAIDEARMLSQLNHPNITMHYDSFIDKDDKLNIIMEYASKGNVASLIKNNRGKGMPEDMVWKILIQSIMGLNHIHSKKIIHRDIKALNLFLDSSNNIKIGDLGIARALSDGSAFAHTIVGTPYYLSPELCEDKPYNEKSDIWALGVVLYECCTGHYPFEAQNEGALIRKILRGQYTPISGQYTNTLVQLISTLLTFKPQQRPDSSTILRNPAVIAKAKALGINLSPRPTGSTEDQPVYEPRQQQPQQQALYPSGENQFQQQQQQQYQQQGGGQSYPQQYSQQGGGQQYNQHYNQQPPHHQQQQQYHGSGGRPGSARPAGGGGPHPFDLPPQRPQQPGGGGGGGQQRQQVQVPMNQPYGLHVGPGGGPPVQDPWDVMADEIQRYAVGTQEFNRLNAERQQGLQKNMDIGRRDNVKEVFGHPDAPTPQNFRLKPEALPAAGARGGGPGHASPYALHYADARPQTQTQLQSSAVWGANYSPPQYGRRRCPELQITGPSLRGATGGRPGSAHVGGGYVGAADDATTYVSSSYNTYYK